MSEMKIDLKNRIVGIFGGCYCPPHSGHYKSVVDAIQNFKLSVVIITIYGREDPEEARHGVPEKESVRVWNEWGEIIWKKYKCGVIVQSMYNNLNYVSSDVGYILDIRIAESPEQKEQWEKESFRYSPTFFKNVPRDHISRVITVRETESGLSSTNFIKCLKTDKDCLEYTPTDIPLKQRKSYINRLKKEYGKYLK